MKHLVKLTLILACTVASAGVGYSQTRLDVKAVSLSNRVDPSMRLTLGATELMCRQVLGQPDRISRSYGEMDEDTITVFWYGRNELSFLHHGLVGFDLVEPSIQAGVSDGVTFKVGDAYSQDPGKQKRVAAFSSFPANLPAGVYRDTAYASGSVIYLKRENTEMDYRYSFLFDAHKKLIRITFTD